MDERLSTEDLGESKQHIPEKKNEVHKIEMFLGELLAARQGAEVEQILSLLTTVCLFGWLGIWVGCWLVSWLVGGGYVSVPKCVAYK